MPKLTMSKSANPNVKCRDCGETMPPTGGHSTCDVGALFFGQSAVVCDGCWERRSSEKKMAEDALVAAGYSIIHISQEDDEPWLGGRWHAHKAGKCFAAHSYRDGCIQNAYNAHQFPVDNREPDGWTCDCEPQEA